jgi:hypothetical protein
VLVPVELLEVDELELLLDDELDEDELLLLELELELLLEEELPELPLLEEVEPHLYLQ